MLRRFERPESIDLIDQDWVRRFTSGSKASRQSATMPTSHQPQSSQSGSGLMPTTVLAPRRPTVWLNFPDVPMAMHSRGAMAWPVMPT